MKTFAHGVHPPAHKQLTAATPVRRLGFAPVLTIPLSQHIGAPARAIVRAGQEVGRGEIIAEADGFRSVPMHAPATGVVRRLAPAPNEKGRMVDAIWLEPYAASTQDVQWPSPESAGPRDFAHAAPEEIVQAVQDAGIVGMGGAAFPTHVKLRVPPKTRIDTCIVNGAECEPYLTSDHRVMLERTADIFAGIRIVARATGARRAIIGVENNKADAIAALRAFRDRAGGDEANTNNLQIEITPLAVKYPEGASHILIKALLNREIPHGGHASDVGVEISNVATLAEIGKLLPRSQGLIERVITVSGPGVRRPGNYLIPLGTPLWFVLESVGLITDASALQLVLGGPMMGTTVSNVNIPVSKAITGVVVLPDEDSPAPEFPCIRCARCVDACPLFLNPARLGALAAREEYTQMADEAHLWTCFECGSCSFVCPSNIPLVQRFRAAKSYLRQNG